MYPGTVAIYFLCLIFKETISTIYIIDNIPSDHFNKNFTDQDHAYYDNEMYLAKVHINTPKPNDIEPLKSPNSTEHLHDSTILPYKKICQRFGNMYGIPKNSHTCKTLIRMWDRIRRESNQIGDESKEITRERKLTDLKSDNNLGFAQDYADNIWRSEKPASVCTLKDVINNKCKLKLNEKRSESKGISDSRNKSEGRIPILANQFKLDDGKYIPKDYIFDLFRNRLGNAPCSLNDIFNQNCNPNLGTQKSKSVKPNERIAKPIVQDHRNYVDERSNVGFSEDYIADLFGNRIENAQQKCISNGIVNNKCRLSLGASNQPKQIEITDYKSDIERGRTSPLITTEKYEFISGNNDTFAENYIDDLMRIKSLKNSYYDSSTRSNATGYNLCKQIYFVLKEKQANLIGSEEKDFSLDYTNGIERAKSLKNLASTWLKVCMPDSGIQTGKQADGFAENYIVRFSSPKNLKHSACTLNDIINNKCKLYFDNLMEEKPTFIESTEEDFNDDYVAEWRSNSLKNDIPSNNNFAHDYVDYVWRKSIPKPRPAACTISDIINKKCKLNLDTTNKVEGLNPNLLKSDYKANSNTGNISWKRENTSFKFLPIINKNVHNKENNVKLRQHLPETFEKDYADYFWRQKTLENAPNVYNRKSIAKLRQYAPETIESEYDDYFWAQKRLGNALNVQNRENISKTESDLRFSTDYANDYYTRNQLQFNIPSELESNVKCDSSIDPTCKARRTQFSDESSIEERSRKKKTKRFQIVKNNKKSKKSKKEKFDYNSSSSKSRHEKKTKHYKYNDESTRASSEENIGNTLTEVDDTDTSDSFETGPRKPSERYQYLQGHRYVKPNQLGSKRRTSRLETFLPKRYHWKRADIQNLGYYWYEGPKGSFPSEYMT